MHGGESYYPLLLHAPVPALRGMGTPNREVFWLTDHCMPPTFPGNPQWFIGQPLPAYSDGLAQELHLFPFSCLAVFLRYHISIRAGRQAQHKKEHDITKQLHHVYKSRLRWVGSWYDCKTYDAAP